MGSKSLEQMLDILPVGLIAKYYTTIEIYTNGFSQMNHIPGHWAYCTCPRCHAVQKEFEEKFRGEGEGNISTGYDFGKIIGEKKLEGYGLTERYDFSGHDGTTPHLNQDIINTNNGDNLINSGTSQRSEDGLKGLGNAHNIDLFKNDK